MVLHCLARLFIIFLLCVAVFCIRFYLFENLELASDNKMKRVVLKSKPTECLGECVHLDGCESFNVFRNKNGKLICDLYAISNSTLQIKPHTMHFTVNGLASTQPPPELATEVTTDPAIFPETTLPKPVTAIEEPINIVRKNTSHSECVSSNLKLTSKDSNSICEKFYFIDGGALRRSNQKCAQISSDDQVKFSTTSACDNFTFENSVKQFQHTNNIKRCIRFFGDRKPMLDNCYDTYQYEKEKL